VCDVRPAAETGFEGSDFPYFASIEALLAADLSLDVVCICTPNGLHEPQAVLALEAGLHVVIEKPMALTRAGCERVIHKALERSRQVFCVMQNRYSPPSQWLKEIVSQGILGNIFLVQINCFWNRDARYYRPGDWHGTRDLDGGTLFTQFSHFVDMMYWLFGDITDLQARFGDFTHAQLTEFEDSGIVSFRFIRGGMGVLSYSTAVWERNLESSLTIIAEKGSVKVSGQYMNEVVACEIDGYALPSLAPTNPSNDYGPYKGSAANHQSFFENVVDVLKGRSSITTNALEGMKVVEIIERVYRRRDEMSAM
jgi:predicted dehydrogenase